MADYECTKCGGSGWVNGRACDGVAHTTRVAPCPTGGPQVDGGTP